MDAFIKPPSFLQEASSKRKVRAAAPHCVEVASPALCNGGFGLEPQRKQRRQKSTNSLPATGNTLPRLHCS